MSEKTTTNVKKLNDPAAIRYHNMSVLNKNMFINIGKET